MLKRIGRYSFQVTPTDSPPGAGPLLASKLAPPPWRGELIERPRLIERLNQIEPQQVVVLAAPTGFGKTTLLNAWVRQTDRAIAWITLDEADNDPARFGAYFVAALDRLYPGIGAPMRPILQAPQPVPIEWSVIGLLNAIAARPEAITLVLDDCHTLHAPEIYHGLALLIDHLPANLSIVLASRANPPLPLARWRARRQLVELRADALRFSADEAARLFGAMRVELSEDELGLLTAQTEGWAAGLYLAARSIEAEPRGARLLHSLSGNNRFIADYLIDEVLGRQPDQIQQFLLHTSILRRLSAALCDAVINQPGSQATLERLENDNLLVPLDADRRWYRYHLVFAEFFRARLERLDMQLVAILHRRAAEWYAEHGDSASAVEHALAAGDTDLAISLIDAQAEALIERGEIATLRGWLAMLARPVVERNPRLSLWYAWADVAAFQLESAEQWLRAAAAAGDDTLAIEIKAVSAIIAAIRGDVPYAIAMATDLLAGLPPDQLRLRQTLGILIGFGSLLNGDGTPPPGLIARGELALVAGEPAAEMRRLHYYATFYRLRGQLQVAKVVYQRQLAIAGSIDARPIFGGMLAQLGLSAILYEQDELDEAQRLVEACLEYARHVGAPPMIVDGLLIRSHIQEAHGDLAAALETLRQIEDYVRHSALQGHAIWLTSSHQARLWLKIGDRPAAAAWARAYEGGELALIGGPPQEIHQYTCDIALARIRIAQGQLEAAGELLDRIRQLAEQNARLQLLVEAMIVRAELWQARGNSYQAQQSLTHALALAEAEGYVQLFARASAPIRSLLAQLYETMRSQPAQVPGQPSFGYIARLRSRLGSGAPTLASILGAQIVPAPPAERAEAQPEQLSQREREVLRKLAEGRSNQQIARELFISIATVKTHLIHIYRKLGARTRTEALAQARAQHLL